MGRLFTMSAAAMLLLLAEHGYGQDSRKLSGRVLDKQRGEGLVGAEIILRTTSQAFRAMSDWEGRFSIGVPAAAYTVEINRYNFPTELHNNVIISPGDTAITLFYSTPCRFHHPQKWVPTCPLGHRDHLIPVVYGFPSAAMMKKAKAGKISLGGCVHSGCEPTYYCVLHDKEL